MTIQWVVLRATICGLVYVQTRRNYKGVFQLLVKSAQKMLTSITTSNGCIDRIMLTFRHRASLGGRAVLWPWEERHGRGLASVNQARPHCVNQMVKTHFKPLAARHGRGTAWARHAMCESAFKMLCLTVYCVCTYLIVVNTTVWFWIKLLVVRKYL